MERHGVSIAALALSLFSCVGVLSVVVRQPRRNGDRRGRFYTIAAPPGGAWPGEEQIKRPAARNSSRSTPAASGRGPILTVTPKDREVLCIAYHPRDATGSLRR